MLQGLSSTWAYTSLKTHVDTQSNKQYVAFMFKKSLRVFCFNLLKF